LPFDLSRLFLSARSELVEERFFVRSSCLSVKDIVSARTCFDKLNMSGKGVERMGDLFCDLFLEAQLFIVAIRA
jgi:hypothetical protein